MRNKELRKCNAILAAEHGHTGGMPNFRWENSEDLLFPRRELDANKQALWEYSANAEGLILCLPKFKTDKMCPWLHNQWVLCRYMPPPTETVWKDTFGTQVEYPKNGYYANTNISLDRGIAPWDTDGGGISLTSMVSKMAMREREKTYAQHYQDGVDAVEHREKETDRKLEDMILDLRLPFADAPHVPGKKQSVSLPATKQDPGLMRQSGE